VCCSDSHHGQHSRDGRNAGTTPLDEHKWLKVSAPGARLGAVERTQTQVIGTEDVREDGKAQAGLGLSLGPRTLGVDQVVPWHNPRKIEPR